MWPLRRAGRRSRTEQYPEIDVAEESIELSAELIPLVAQLEQHTVALQQGVARLQQRLADQPGRPGRGNGHGQ